MVLDIILLVIMLIIVGISAYRGAIKMISGIVAIILAYILAVNFSAPVSSFVYDAWAEPMLTSFVAEKIEETGATETISGIMTTVTEVQANINALTESEQFAEISNKVGEVTSNIQDAVTDTTGEGVLDNIAGSIDDATDGAGLDTITGTVSDALSGVGIDINIDDLTNIEGFEGLEGIAEFTEGLKGLSENELVQSLKGTYDNAANYFEGISPSVTNAIVEKTNLSDLERLAKNASVMPSDAFAGNLVYILKAPIMSMLNPLCFGVVYLIALVLATVALSLVTMILEKTPLVGKAIHIIGGVIGLVLGLALVMGICTILNATVSYTSALYPYVSESICVDVSSTIVDKTMETFDITVLE